MTNRLKNKLGWTYDVIIGAVALIGGMAVSYGAFGNQIKNNKECITEIKEDTSKQNKINTELLVMIKVNTAVLQEQRNALKEQHESQSELIDLLKEMKAVRY